jgi:hypothetical protein
MKKTLIILAGILAISLISINALAWDDCPFGFEDEPYPGTCWRYVDINNDGICDHSQSESVVLNPESSAQQESQSGKNVSSNTNNRNYILITIISFLSIIIGAVLGKILVRRKIISKIKEKLFWNILLLIFFIHSGVTGIIILFLRDLTFLIEYGTTFSQLHNISSLFFMWISAYHIIWHTSYYMKCLKK